MHLIRRLLMAALLLACGLFVYRNWDYLAFSRLGVYELAGPANVRVSAEGGLLVVDDGSSVLLRTDREGTVQQILYQSAFDSAADAATDAQGNLYILDLVRTGSRRLMSERVLMFSPDGRFVEEVYRYEHGETDNRQRLVHISCRGDRLLFVELLEDAFAVHTRDGVGQLEQRVVEYPDALSLIWQFASGSDTLAGLDKQGRVFRVGAIGVETLYNAPDVHPDSIPGDLAVGADGSVYITDLGLRQISLVQDGAQTPLYTGAEDFYERIIFTRLDAGSELALSSEYGLLLLDGADENWIEQLPVSTGLMIRRLLLWSSVVVGSFILLYFAGLGVRALLRHRGRVMRISVAVLSGALLLSTVFSLIVMKDINQRMIREKHTRLTTAAQLTAKLVPTGAFEAVNGVGDYLGEDYRRVQSSVREVFLGESALQEDMYGILYRVRDDVVTIIYATEENTSLYPYDWEYPDSNMEWILHTGLGEEDTYSSSEGQFIYTLQPILDEDGQPVGIIEMGADLEALHRENRAILLELYLNILSISVVIVLVATECAVFLESRRERAARPPVDCPPVEVTRMGVFLVFFIANMCTAFLPLYAISLLPESGIAFLSQEQLAAFPLSADVLFGAFAALLGHRVHRRLGSYHTGLLAAALFMAGMVLKCLPSYSALMLGSAVFGLGWGLLLLLCSLCMAAQPTQELKNTGFAGYTAAMLSGVNCGVVVGSFLLNWFSYSAVIIISAVLGLLIPFFVVSCMRRMRLTAETAEDQRGKMGTLRFLCTPRVLVLFVALVIPMLAGGYFLNYLYPIVGYGMGISEVNIGYTFLLYNLLVVCFGRLLLKRLYQSIGKVLTLLLWGGIYAGAFLLFARLQTVPALLVALALLGLSDGFGLALYPSYFTDLPEVEAYGQDRAVGMLNVVENIAQAAGPFLFSMVLVGGNGWSLELMAGGLLALVLLFTAISLPGQIRDRRRTEERVEQTL